MKKLLSIILIVVLSISLTACGGKKAETKDTPKDTTTKVEKKETKKETDTKDNKDKKHKDEVVDKNKIENANHYIEFEMPMTIAESEVILKTQVWVKGKKQLLSISGSGQTMKTVTHDLGKTSYLWVEGQKTGSIFKDSETKGKTNSQADQFSMNRAVRILKGEEKGFKKIGEEEILGYKCETYQLDDTPLKLSISREIPAVLKTEVSIQGKTMTSTAKKVEKGKVKDSVFEIPKDIKFTESNL